MNKSKDYIRKIYNLHVNTVYRVCFTYMRGSKMDMEDAVSETFIKFMNTNRIFKSDEHIKAWLIVTASNTCKNMLKRKYRDDIPLDENIINDFEYVKNDDLLESVLALPKYERISLFLYYYEGYTASEIAGIIGKKQSTVWSYLSKGRNNLRSLIEEEA